MKKNLLLILAVCAVLFAFSGVATAQLKNCSEPGSLMSVKKSRVGKFEYVTFELRANDPAYEVSNAKPPFTDYSGDTILRIKGKSFKSIQFRGVSSECKVREDFRAATTTVQGIKNTEQFEGYITYVIGYSARNKYVGVSVSGVGSSKVVLKFKR